jgi:ribonuclease BN (tRNA processing enzyme)
MDCVHVTFLGTGDAFSAGGRHQSAYLIEAGKGVLLLDCGASILAALKRLKMTAEPIDAIFISHLHGDHFAGLPFLFLHYIYVEPRERQLTIIGPAGVQDRVQRLYEVNYADSAAEPLPFALKFIEVQSGNRLSVGGIQINPFHVPHQRHPPSFGCEIETGGRKIVYSGDSGWTEELVAHTQNADLFICECSYFDTPAPSHLNYSQIAKNLEHFAAKRIVLTHLGEEILQRQSDVDIEMAYDGLAVTI